VNVPGYIPAERFLKLLEFIGDGHMDRGVDFQEFVQAAPDKKP
jgi:thioredoxin-related protein